MKNVVLIFVLFVGINAIAQKKESKNLSPEQFATLSTKKMTLELDLNDKQQTEIYQLNLENATNRATKKLALKNLKESNASKKLSTDERYAMQSEMLDYQIAQKEKMKSILNDVQFEKWENMKRHKMEKRQKGKYGQEGRNSRKGNNVNGEKKN